MNRRHTACFSLLLGFALALGGIADAHAKRLGGGGSFGGKSAFNTPFKRSAQAPVRSPKQQQAAHQNAAARQSLANRGGLMGMLGGLAIGGLLGALFFGGAFENLNFLDLLLFGGVAFMLYRLLAARARADTPRPAYARRPAPSGGSFDTRDWFRAGGARAPVPLAADATFEDSDEYADASMPAGFAAAEFLAGARRAYRDLQSAWDAHDVATLRRLSTSGMYDELERRSADLGAHNRTDVLKLEAELLDAREVEGMLEAVVLFDAILREDAGGRAQQVREVWHFTRPLASAQPTWFLDGIQQLED